MIPRDYITEWRTHAPWVDDLQVEQDLVISRALVDIFSEETLSDAFAFRGGTALYKLHLPAARYSEDIDLVQIRAEPAGPAMGALNEALSPWLGEPAYKQSDARITYRYKFQSEQGLPMRLKVEINTREHFAVDGIRDIPYSVDSRWYQGACAIPTYELNELLATKLRALYQRKKGRDLFDLATGLGHENAAPEKIIAAFNVYMDKGGHRVSRKQFENNLARKLKDRDFIGDISPLLASGYKWDLAAMSKKVRESLISQLAD